MMASQGGEAATGRELWPGIAGIVSGGLLITGVLLTWRTPDTDGKDAIREVVSFYSKESNQNWSEAVALILLASAMLFLFFLAALTRAAGSRGTLVIVGGTMFAVSLTVAAISGNIYAITAGYSDVFPVAPATALIAILLLDVAYGALIGAMAGAAVMLFAVWRAARTTPGAVPQWLAWAGFVVAVLSLAGPVSAWLTPLLLAVWMVAAGAVMVARGTVAKAAA
ncbi:hypothetical protein [Streptomyces apocyni]|uniref:hypothetical protein n=1 Tax=Streptomyces apocyni TaxID=2654677 RepID=UPI0012E99A4C|nr:hypothetical protein [Streptomyces apocyni]